MHASHAFLSSSFSVILAVCAVECNSHFLVAAREVQAPLVTFGRMPFEKFKLFGAAVAGSVCNEKRRKNYYKEKLKRDCLKPYMGQHTRIMEDVKTIASVMPRSFCYSMFTVLF